MPGKENNRDERSRGFSAAGDAACIWHRLDEALQGLCGVRSCLEAAGREALVGEAQKLIDTVEDAYAEAEEELAETL